MPTGFQTSTTGLATGPATRPAIRLGRGAAALLVSAAFLALGGCTPEAPDERAGGTADGMGEADVSAPLLVAHRGASGYAPEHTLQAYELALAQGADILEPDLQMTRDGVLIAFHDITLNRTTNVDEVFPDRYREETVDGQPVRRWYVYDFTLDELRRLDAGSWFGEAFAGARIMTFDEVLQVAHGRAGVFPETKSPEVYRELGLDMERAVIADLERHGLDEPGAVPATPVLIQSFNDESLRVLRDELGTDLTLVFLLSGSAAAEQWLTADGLEEMRAFADGIGPNKNILLADPEIVQRAHALGMTVIPWTFRVGGEGNFPDVTAEMAHFLFELGVDGLFTDNPDLFPRTPPADGSGTGAGTDA